MLQALLNEIQALINERGSATVLRERLALLADQVGALQRENDGLREQVQKLGAQRDQAQDQARRFAQDNPNGWRCDGCGSVDLARTGGRLDPTFGRLGVRQAAMTCRVCGAVSHFTEG